MVKVEGLSDDQIFERKAHSRLVQMTKDMVVGQENLRVQNQPFVSISVFDENGDIVIHASPSFRKVEVNSQPYFEIAHELALAYEEEIGEEFTLKKQY